MGNGPAIARASLDYRSLFTPLEQTKCCMMLPALDTVSYHIVDHTFRDRHGWTTEPAPSKH